MQLEAIPGQEILQGHLCLGQILRLTLDKIHFLDLKQQVNLKLVFLAQVKLQQIKSKRFSPRVLFQKIRVCRVISPWVLSRIRWLLRLRKTHFLRLECKLRQRSHQQVCFRNLRQLKKCLTQEANLNPVNLQIFLVDKN